MLAVASLALLVALVGEGLAGSSFVATTVGRAATMDSRGYLKSLSPVPELRAGLSPAVFGFRSTASSSNLTWFAAGAAVIALGLSLSSRDEKIQRGSFGKQRMWKTKLNCMSQEQPEAQLETLSGSLFTHMPATLSFAGQSGAAGPISFPGARTAPGVTSSVSRRMLMPKTIKWKKPHKPAVKPYHNSTKWKFKGYSQTGNKPIFGKYAMQALEEGWVSSRIIEICRRALVKIMERKGKIWIRIFPHNAITERVAETRMGAGKGGIEYWAAVVRPHFILFEVDGVTEEIARRAFDLAAWSLSMQCRFIKKTDGPSLFELGLAGKEKQIGGPRLVPEGAGKADAKKKGGKK